MRRGIGFALAALIAVKDAGLDDENIAGKLVRKLAKKHPIPPVSTGYRFTIADPKHVRRFPSQWHAGRRLLRGAARSR